VKYVTLSINYEIIRFLIEIFYLEMVASKKETGK